MAEKEKRFIKVYSQSGGFSGPSSCILVDSRTGVNYLYVSGGYGAGLTPLINRDGTPIVTPVSKKYEE